MHLNEVAESVKQGIWAAGGVPYNLPVVSLGETQVKPTAMLWRNMAAMAMEEMFRANPIDGVVLLGGCDKTIPALLMAAASVDLPAIVVPGGPMLTGHFRGEALGCGTDVWRLSEEERAGTLSNADFTKSEGSMIRSKGHCNTMGTASTMAVVAEALGMTIPGFAGTPAPDARLLTKSHETGRLIVELIEQGRRPSDIMTRESFLNAIIAVAAVGGSTNSVMHLLAIAGRLGIELDLDDFDEAGRDVPLLVNLQPSGQFLMDDLYRAGGVLAALAQVKDLLHPDADHGHRATARRLPGRPADLRRQRHPVAQGTLPRGRRHRRAARQPRSARGDHQARCGDPRTADPPRPGRRVREHRGLHRPDRRPRPRGDRRLGAGASRMRSARLPGDAGGRQHAAAAQAARAGACATWCGSATPG